MTRTSVCGLSCHIWLANDSPARFRPVDPAQLRSSRVRANSGNAVSADGKWLVHFQGAHARGPQPSTRHPAQQTRWRGWRYWRAWRCRLTTSALCKLLAGMVASLVVFHAASCGFFFCYRIPGEVTHVPCCACDAPRAHLPGFKTAELGSRRGHHKFCRWPQQLEQLAAGSPAGPLDLQFLPPAVSAYDEIRNIYRLRGGPHIISGGPSLLSGSGGGSLADAPDEAPKLIPAIIHQTYKSAKVPPAVRPFMQVRRPFSD